jgi:mono/diheme cytochrome c family protein
MRIRRIARGGRRCAESQEPINTKMKTRMTMKPQNRWLVTFIMIAGASCVGVVSSHAADVTAAQKNYQGFCAACHGNSGGGNGLVGASLTVKPMNFDDCAAMGRISDDTLFKAIKSGGKAVGKSPQMPAVGAAFNDSQIHDLVAYVRRFCKK